MRRMTAVKIGIEGRATARLRITLRRVNAYNPPFTSKERRNITHHALENPCRRAFCIGPSPALDRIADPNGSFLSCPTVILC